MRTVAITCAVIALAVTAGGRLGAQTGVTTTSHPPLPGHPSLYWLVPTPTAASRPAGRQAAEAAPVRFARGAALIAKDDFAAGLPLVRTDDLAATPLAAYSRYYTGVALLGLRRPEEAEAVLAAIGNMPVGYLEEAVPLRLAEAAVAAGHPDRAIDVLEDLSDDEDLASPEAVLVQLATAFEAAGEGDKAFRAYQRVYYEFPLTNDANTAQAGMERLLTPGRLPAERFTLERDRAEALFTARRWAQARAAFAALARAGSRDDRELMALRLAECDYYLGRHRAAREALAPYLDDASREAEARFFHLTAVRALGDQATYVRLARELVADHSDSSWAEETLNNLASHYITNDDEAAADDVFRELARRFPKSRYGDRAAWKVGWLAYKQDRFADAAATFEVAAAAFPRSDYRPTWLYWAARSRDQLGARPAAGALYRIVAADYLNSYYGRLASAILAERREPVVRPTVAVETTPVAPLVPNDAVIRALIGAGLYDDALREVEYARETWGDAAPLQATVAWIRNRRGLAPGANERFLDVRGAITIMRRAYPQFMAAGGEQLPPDVLRVIFPLDYWPLIRKYSDAHKLDPYLMTALIAQESTFTPDIRSSANAVGLMQLIPGTGRRYAGKLGIRYSARILTQPETNIRLGMRYFKDLIDRFGGAHFALASYNAGESRIARWIEERPGFTQDEFIDDIPFPETQTYVKRILGTADDYRRLYGGGVLSASNASR